MPKQGGDSFRVEILTCRRLVVLVLTNKQTHADPKGGTIKRCDHNYKSGTDKQKMYCSLSILQHD